MSWGWKRFAARAIAEASALTGRGRVRPGYRVLLYHAVGSRLARDPYGISIEPKLFERQMEALARNSQFSVASFHAPQSSHAQLQVAVTFDDGYRDNLYTAAPILLKFKIPFTVFVTSSFIRSQSDDFLTPAELRELASLPGVTVGSHGATHLPLDKCDDSTLWQELYESRCYIEDVTGTTVRAIAYPHGSVTLRVRDAAQRAGYVIGGCSRFDINDEDRDPLLLCRCEVVAADSERVFQQKLRGAWDWYRLRAKDPAAG
ncbi:MAG: polysaccharide deacetylase family protein [Acidobacteria bacterium]|nr:polysaccharide deacetylase family protein [Acidobacteriota bacterium]